MAQDGISINTAAQVAARHPDTIRAWIKRRYLRSWKVGGQYRVSESELRAYLNGEAQSA